MSKTTAPLLSFDARGQVAKTVVYSSWRGVKYARRHVVPANPQTTAQQNNRLAFATMREMWKLAPAGLQAPWTAFATGRAFTNMNAFVGENRLAIKTDVDMQEFIGSPGARGGLPPAGISAAAGAGSGDIDVTFVAPDVPPDWTLTKYAAVAFPDQDPTARFEGPLIYGEVDSPTLVVPLAGLPAATLCVVAGWTIWTKPDGKTAYGVSLATTATTT